MHVGPYGGLQASHEALVRWAEREGVALDRRGVEHYRTDPRQEPDSAGWETDVAYGATRARLSA